MAEDGLLRRPVAGQIFLDAAVASRALLVACVRPVVSANMFYIQVAIKSYILRVFLRRFMLASCQAGAESELDAPLHCRQGTLTEGAFCLPEVVLSVAVVESAAWLALLGGIAASAGVVQSLWSY